MKHHRSIKKASTLYSLSLIAFFTNLHLSLPTYFNSGFLSTFTDEKTISLIYLIISIVTIVGLLLMQDIIRKFGNFRTALALLVIQIAIFYGISNSNSSNIILPLFILGMSIISLIGFTIDIFIQRNSDFAHTGSVRGLLMTVSNAAWIFGPLIGGMLLIQNDLGGDSIATYKNIYVVGFALLLPIIYLVQKNFSNFKDLHYEQISARQTISRILKDRDISRIFIVNIILQSFYAWMTIYIPIYLHQVIHFNWSEISIIFTIMLIPFVLVDYPLGKLADKEWGEKEMMASGFIIMAISTGLLFFLTLNNVFIWALMLFITRIGAATAEIMIETYFFKKVDGEDPEVLSMFRITRPLSYFIAPLIVTISLSYTTENYLFFIFGLIFLFTLYPILTIRDTN